MDTTTIYDFDEGPLSLSEDELEDDYAMAWNIPLYWEGRAGLLPPVEEYSTDSCVPCLEEPVHEPPVPPVRLTICVCRPLTCRKRQCQPLDTYLPSIQESIDEAEARTQASFWVRCFSD